MNKLRISIASYVNLTLHKTSLSLLLSKVKQNNFKSPGSRSQGIKAATPLNDYLFFYITDSFDRMF